MPLDQAGFAIPAPVVEDARPFTLPHFRNWLREQIRAGRGDEEYCWADCGKCLYHQYGRARGLPEGDAYSSVMKAIREHAYWMLSRGVALKKPHTFAGALNRFEAGDALTGAADAYALKEGGVRV